EQLAPAHVLDRLLQARRQAAADARGDLQARVLQRRHRDLEALALGADPVLVGDDAALEPQLADAERAHAELALLLGHREARRVALDDEPGDPARARLVRVR